MQLCGGGIDTIISVVKPTELCYNQIIRVLLALLISPLGGV